MNSATIACAPSAVGLAHRPVPVGVRRDVGALVRIHAQIEEQREAATVNGSPQISRVPGVCCSQNTNFQFSTAHRDEVAVVVEVDEILPVGLVLLAGQVGNWL